METLPPSAQESEQAVIGCCLISPKESLPEAQQVLTSGHFYDARCQLVWETLYLMEPHEIDLISVRQKLIDGGKFTVLNILPFLNECQDLVPSSANLPSWISEIEQKFILRRIISTCSNLSQMAYGASLDALSILDTAESQMLAIRPSQRINSDIKGLVQDAVNQIDQKWSNKGSITGLDTGLIDLDKLSDGLHKGELIVPAGFPSTGKTALAMGIVVHNALKGTPCAVFSAEMRPVQLVVRALCTNTPVNYHKLNEMGEGFLQKMVIAAGKISKSPLFIESAHGATIGQICASARRLKQKHNIRLMAVDYIQLLAGTGDNREQQVASISKGLKSIALELDITVLALSQLNDDGRMRESRAISQDADTIWKLENDGDWQPLVQPVKLRIEKCRDGETGIVNLTFLKGFTRFESASKISDEDVP